MSCPPLFSRKVNDVTGILSAGEVRFEALGESNVLRCTPRAAKEVNAYFGSFTNAMQRIEAMDFEAFVVVVAAGLKKKRADVEELTYDAGIMKLMKPISNFVVMLANGGRAPTEDDGSKEPKTGES